MRTRRFVGRGGNWWISIIHRWDAGLDACTDNVPITVTSVTLRCKSVESIIVGARRESLMLLSDQSRLLALIIGCAVLWRLESLIPLYRYQPRRWRRALPNLALQPFWS